MTSASVPVCTTRPCSRIDEAVGERRGVDRIVGDEDADAGERLHPRAEVAPHRDPRLLVERGERLVEHEQARRDRERARERDALRLPAGERGRPVASA